MNCSPLKIILKELIKKKLVEKLELKENFFVYKATPKAKTVLSEFDELKEMLPVI
jgi:predicted transcriptional regulator